MVGANPGGASPNAVRAAAALLSSRARLTKAASSRGVRELGGDSGSYCASAACTSGSIGTRIIVTALGTLPSHSMTATIRHLRREQMMRSFTNLVVSVIASVTNRRLSFAASMRVRRLSTDMLPPPEASIECSEMSRSSSRSAAYTGPESLNALLAVSSL